MRPVRDTERKCGRKTESKGISNKEAEKGCEGERERSTNMKDD